MNRVKTWVMREDVEACIEMLAFVVGDMGQSVHTSTGDVTRWGVWWISPESERPPIGGVRSPYPLLEVVRPIPTGRRATPVVGQVQREASELAARGRLAGLVCASDTGRVHRLSLSVPDGVESWHTGDGRRWLDCIEWTTDEQVVAALFPNW